jgi:hypothetical protein
LDVSLGAFLSIAGQLAASFILFCFKICTLHDAGDYHSKDFAEAVEVLDR